MLIRSRTFSALLHGALSLSMLASGIPAHAAGQDGVEFQTIPINISNECSSVILKGTNKYRGYAFKLPQVVLSMDRNYEDLFEILPKANGQYALRFGLMFAFTEDAIEIRRERSNVLLKTCNDNVVLAELNQAGHNDADASSDKNKGQPLQQAQTQANAGTIYENEIKRLSPLPISSVQVSIDGFQNMDFIIGAAENNILDNQNRDLVANFNIPDQETYNQVKDQLTGQMGLSVTIKMTFTAKAANGRDEFELDLKSIADSLEGAAGGKASLQAVVGEADLRAYLAHAISQTAVHIRNEAGDDDNSNRLANDIMTRFITANISAVPMLPGQTWNPNACINNPMGSANCTNTQNGGYYPNYGGFGGTTGTGLPDPNSTGNGTMTSPVQPGLGTPGPSLGSQLEPANTAPNYFKLGAILNALRVGSKQTFVWENFGKNQTYSYTTTALIRGNIPDPGFKTMNVTAGSSDSEAASFPNFIKMGDTVRIKVPGHRQLLDSYNRRTDYLNTEDVTRQGLGKHFGYLQEAVSKGLLKDEINSEYAGGGYVATYRQNSGVNPFYRWYQQSLKGNDMSQWKYNWGIDQLVHSTMMKVPQDVDLEQKNLAQVPMRVMFTNSGKRYKLVELSQPTDKWDGKFEDGEIVMTAKADLGYMKIRNDEVVQNPNRVAQKYLFQVREPILKANQRPPNGRKLSDLREYDFVKFSDSADVPTERVGNPDLRPFAITKGVYVVMVGLTDSKNPYTPVREEVQTTITPTTGSGGPAAAAGGVNPIVNTATPVTPHVP